MRLLTLDLLAWGPFTGRSLDLSGGHEGLHLVYGPNEAGKSSALRALRALLYGVDARAQDSFLHAYSDLRIRSRIRHSDGSTVDVTRRKGNKKTLLAPDDVVLPDDTLDRFLGGITQALYARHFGMNHEDLVAGGRELLEGGGGMAEGLFAAAAGAGNLRRLLTDLDQEAQQIYGSRAAARTLNQLLDRYKTLRAEIQALAVPGRDWEEHDQKLREAKERKAGLTARLGGARNGLARIQRLEKAIPLAARRARLLQDRAEMGDVRLLAEDFARTRRETANKLSLQRDTLREVLRKAAETQAQLDALRVPAGLLDREDEITGLFQDLGARREAAKDLPKRRAAMDAALADARRILEDLQPGLPLEQAVSLRIDMARRTRIRNLATRRSAIATRIETSEKTRRQLAERLERARESLRQLGSRQDFALLKSLLQRVQQEGDLTKALSEVESNLQTASSEAQVALSALPLRPGSLEEIASLPVPPEETLRRFEGDLQAIGRKIEQLGQSTREKAARAAAVGSEIESLRAEAAVPTEEELARARARRESGWALVHAAWLERIDDREAVAAFDPELPLDRAYERSVARADDVADRLRHEADRVARNSALLAERGELAVQLSGLQKEEEEATTARAALIRDWKAIWEPCGIEPYPPQEMRAWLVRQQELCGLVRKVWEYGHKAAQIRDGIGAFRAEVSQALDGIGEPPAADGETFGALLERARNLVERLENLDRKRTTLTQSADQLAEQIAEQEREQDAAAAELGAWAASWSKTVQGLTRDGELPPEAADGFLDRLEELFTKLADAENNRHRVEAMEGDATRFAQAAARLAEAVAPDPGPVPAEAAVAGMHTRLKQAREDRATRDALRQQLAGYEQERRVSEESIHRLEGRLADLCRTAQCDDPARLEALEADSDRARKLDVEIAGLERELAQIAPRGSVEELVAEALASDPDELPGRRTVVAIDIADLEAGISAADQEIGEQNAELARMDGRADATLKAEQAEAMLAEVRTSAERYIELRTAAALLRAGLEAYRSRNQGPVLQRAGAIFRELTLESFDSLRTEFDENDQPLIAGVRPNGKTVRVEGMSDGTRDQLFLALRLATLELHLRKSEPVPLVLDDALLNFDDERSTATLKVLAAMSHGVQVLFFTHHAHLVDLARSAVANEALFVHRL